MREEIHHILRFEGGRVADIDHDLGTSQCLDQTFTGDGIDALAGGCGDGFMAELLQVGDDLLADKAGTADDDYLHCNSPGLFASTASKMHCA